MNGGTEIVYDTSALIELFLGTKEGEAVRQLFSDESATNLIPSVVILELISKIKRIGRDPMPFIQILEQNSIVLDLNLEVAKKAGDLHAELKTKEKRISVPDCIIMVHAELEDAMILTKDHHFKRYKNARIL